MKRKLITLAVALLLLFVAAPAYADDVVPLPNAFYGSVTINGDPAPIGTMVEARGTGVETGVDGNPTYTVEAGIYGTASPYDPRLIVQGDIQDGATLTFYVNDVSTGQTAAWHSGEVTELDLTVTITEPTPPTTTPSGGGGGAGYDYVKTKIFGMEKAFRITDKGEMKDTIKVTSEDGSLTLTIPKGTFALDKDGKPLKTLEAVIDDSPPDPPANAQILLAYDFGPAGATFDPPINLTWTYDPDELPGAEEDLAFVYYSVDGEWVQLDFEIDTVHNTITASIEHFTTFAVVSMPPATFSTSSLTVSPGEVSPDEKVSISVSVANTGALKGTYTVVLEVNGEKEAEKSVTIAAGGSDTVTFSVSKTEPGTYNVAVDGLTGSFTVKAPPPTAEVTPPVTPEVTPPVTPEVTPPEKAEVTPPEKEEVPAPAPWYQIFQDYWGAWAAGVAAIIIIVLVVTRRRRD